ncbi:hypothetical protein [Aquamicrobium zhengzhouense]|uniref:hypothetical protein n=1 Tax=Aquamicrobium zhengzhouense TaxID=2781738 RepID=UPI001F29F8FB|nr:hypothetical protein [Aquamicrobium zhengzhouense]
MQEALDFTRSTAQGTDAGTALMNLSAILSRIEETVDTETASIRTDIRFDIKSSNARKSRYLYELNKAVSALGAAQLQEQHRDDIARLREKLATNERAILAHLNAVNEVAQLMQDAIQYAEADGTYSARQFG